MAVFIISNSDTDITPLKSETKNQLAIWQEFLDKTIEAGDTIPQFPIWAMEFGATYDFENVAPAFQSTSQLLGKKGIILLISHLNFLSILGNSKYDKSP